VPLQQSITPAAPMMNPMMTGMSFSGFTPSPSGMGWGPGPWPGQVPPMPQQMMSPQQFMLSQPPPNADPNFLAAHQHAMLIAKQAYQYAVAQQAMAAAADEWERQTNTGGSVYGGGGGSVYGGGGSVYGGSQFTGSSANLGGFGGGMWPGMGMGPGMFPSSRSVYDGGSMYGGSDAGGWGSKSVYGESFGPSMPDPRASMYSTRQDSGPRRPGISPAQSAGMQKSNSSQHLGVPGNQAQARPSRSRTKSSPNAPPQAPFASSQRDGSPRSLGRTPKTPPPSSWTARYQTALQD
jgi:serine/arginine repetitive matrix protein 2